MALFVCLGICFSLSTLSFAADNAKSLANVEQDIIAGKKSLDDLMASYEKFENSRQRDIDSFRAKSVDAFGRKQFEVSKEYDRQVAELEKLSLSQGARDALVSRIMQSDEDEAKKRSRLVWVAQKTGWHPKWYYQDPASGKKQAGGTFMPLQKVVLDVPQTSIPVKAWRRSDGSLIREGMLFLPDLYEKEVLVPIWTVTNHFDSLYDDIPSPVDITYDQDDRTMVPFPSLPSIGSRRFSGWLDQNSIFYEDNASLPLGREMYYQAVWRCPVVDLTGMCDETNDGQVEPGERIWLCPVLHSEGRNDDNRYQVRISSSSPYLELSETQLQFGVLSEETQSTWSGTYEKGKPLQKSDGISVKVSPHAVIGQTLDYMLEIVDAKGKGWRYPGVIEVKGPKEYVTITQSRCVEDASPTYANQNGVINPGEKGWLLFCIGNEAGTPSPNGVLTFSYVGKSLHLEGKTVAYPQIPANRNYGGGAVAYNSASDALNASKPGALMSIPFTVDANAKDVKAPIQVSFDDGTHVWKQTLFVEISHGTVEPVLVTSALRSTSQRLYVPDGKVHKGETYEVFALLRNIGEDKLVNASVTLQCDPKFAKVQGVLGLPAIKEKQYALLSLLLTDNEEVTLSMRNLQEVDSPLLITIKDDVPTGTHIPLSIRVNNTFGAVWNFPVDLTVGESQAKLSVVYASVVADRAYQNTHHGDILFHVDAVLSNTGRSALMPCTVSLESDDPEIDIPLHQEIPITQKLPVRQAFSLAMKNPLAIPSNIQDAKKMTNPANGLSFVVRADSPIKDVHLRLVIDEEGGDRFVVPLEIQRK